MSDALQSSRDVDLVIVGGGIAGLWLANVLQGRGYRILLLEAADLGGRQTLASQGMIHGGIKYALGASLTRASEAIASMPARWRACLSGAGEVDLSTLTPLSPRYHLFADASTLGRLAGFFASRTLRGRIEKLSSQDFPPVFREGGFTGVVYALDDLVLDVREVLLALQANLVGRIYRHELKTSEVRMSGDAVELKIAGATITARRLVLCAGAGTQALLDGLGVTTARTQLRPLHQVLVRHDYPHPLFGHCLTGIRRAEPRLTITSHRHGDHWLWYLGGQIATDGVHMSEAELVRHARQELEACVPWISWRQAQFSTLRIDRAEPAQPAGERPDEAFAAACGHTVVCWPTKLSLAPDLSDKVLGLLAPPAQRSGPELATLPMSEATVGWPPWESRR